jgi:hypothetical protein
VSFARRLVGLTVAALAPVALAQADLDAVERAKVLAHGPWPPP